MYFKASNNTLKQRNADNTATITVNKETKSFVIKAYTAADDNVVRWKAGSAMTLQKLYCDTGGTDTVTITLYNGSTTTGLVVAATSSGATDSSASAPNVAVDDMLKFSLSSLQGTGTSVACTLTYYNVGN
jgi:NaMN:DMB phosphoribosyltransferase